MPVNELLQYSAVGFCASLAALALIRDRRSFVHRIFALGMAVLALEAFFNGLVTQAGLPGNAIFWQQWRLMAMAAMSGTWLIFVLTFGRGDFRPVLARRKWVVLAAFLIPLVFVVLLWSYFFQDVSFHRDYGWVFELSLSGYVFHIWFLLSLVPLVMILERTLRASTGLTRWQVKFLLLGIGGIFAARIYTSSQVLIILNINPELEMINASALILSNILILAAVLRAGVLKFDIYFSQRVLQHSLTAILVGAYLTAVGLSTATFREFLSLPVRTLVIFLALLGLLIALLSDRLRSELKRFVSHHFRRPRYDYRQVWMTFTDRTATLLKERALCETVAKMISEMFDIACVSVWLLDGKGENVKCAGSTVYSGSQLRNLSNLKRANLDLVRLLGHRPGLVDLKNPADAASEELNFTHADVFRNARIRSVVPLAAGRILLGFISIGDRAKEQPISFEEEEVLSTIACQVAASLLNIQLAERLRQSREVEAFQTMAAFFVHDLKNLASRLSLMFKNLPVHFDNPDFRDDALQLMSRSVDQINTICGRLSSVREKLEIRPVETDLNHIARTTLDELNGRLKGRLIENLQSLPIICVDPEQIKKVLTNLISNARDAAGDDGKIYLSTRARDERVELTVRDTGCGISGEFMDQCLFRPFKTTKSGGTGIGLFQSKMIVEAHNGTIEVESREGKGSSFRVLLPVKPVT